jgi:hypothetical protein
MTHPQSVWTITPICTGVHRVREIYQEQLSVTMAQYVLCTKVVMVITPLMYAAGHCMLEFLTSGQVSLVNVRVRSVTHTRF